MPIFIRRAPIVSSYLLLAALQSFLHQQRVDVDHLTADPMLRVMVDWYRLVPLDLLERAPVADALVYRYGGWSEGCATGFKLSLLRRITENNPGGAETDWFAGITLMFEPSRYTDLAPLDLVSSDWQSIDAFMRAIESSPAFKALAPAKPMGVMLESGGLR
jgi:hypothetical protein